MGETPDDKIESLRAEALAFLENEPSDFALRSCWHCNAAHEHLRHAEYPINCFDCGHWYFRGVDITEPDEPSER